MPHVSHTVLRPEVPLGPYCYAAGGYCPHIRSKEVAGVKLAWCDLLKMGSIPNGTTDAEYEALKTHYGTHSWTDEETGEVHAMINDHPDTALFLLWDSCKECGVNDWMGGESRGYPFRFHELTADGWRRPFPVTLRATKRATPTQRFREILRQLNRLSKRLRPIIGNADIGLALEGGRGKRCRLSDAGGLVRMAAHLARAK